MTGLSMFRTVSQGGVGLAGRRGSGADRPSPDVANAGLHESHRSSSGMNR